MPRDRKMIEAHTHMKRGFSLLKMARLLETQPLADQNAVKEHKKSAGECCLAAAKCLGVKPAPAKKAPAKKAPAKKAAK